MKSGVDISKSARENRAKAEDIESAIYDLKAVNPNRKTDEDRRTPSELLDFIDQKGREADAALARLRALISTDATTASNTDPETQQ